MGTDTEALRRSFSTAATVLAGVLRRNRDHSFTGACCLVFEDGPELAPCRIIDALGKMALSGWIASANTSQPCS